MARIGVEMLSHSSPRLEGNRVELTADAFIFDASFTNAPYWKKLMRVGAPVAGSSCPGGGQALNRRDLGRAEGKPDQAAQFDQHRQQGRVFLTPHQLSYTLSPRLVRADFERVVSGDAGRAFLDRVQIRHEAAPLTIPPRSGILTSCSMYLKEHFVVLNQGEGNFASIPAPCCSIPIKTFGTNIMLEIYNTGDQPVVNPVVSVEVFRAPRPTTRIQDAGQETHALLATAGELYKCLDENPARRSAKRGRDQDHGQRPERDDGESRAVPESRGRHQENPGSAGSPCGHRTMIQALDAAPTRPTRSCSITSPICSNRSNCSRAWAT